MKRIITVIIAFLFFITSYATDSLSVVYRIRLDQNIDKAAQRLVVLGLEKASAAEADYILLDIDT